MGVMGTSNGHNAQGVKWNLPGVKDLLSGVDSMKTPILTPQLTMDLTCPGLCQTPDSFPKHAKSCRYFLTSQNLRHCPKLQGSHSSYQASSGEGRETTSPLLNSQYRRYSHDSHTTTEGELEMYKHPGALKPITNLPTTFQASSPFRTIRPIQRANKSSINPQMKHEPTLHGSVAGRISSTDHHKLSEKKRRDEMGVFIQVGEILRKGLDPAILSGCTICMEDGDIFGNPGASITILENGSTTAGPASKKTKNDMLAEMVMWEFSIALHLWPSGLGRPLENIRNLAAQMWKEKEFGQRNDFAKSSKWHADSRAEVIEQLLREMEHECEKHGLNLWGLDAQSSIPTPPSSSSRTSPMMGQKRSRETTEEAEQDGRRVRHKEDTGSAST